MATGTKAVDEKVLVRLDDAYERGYLIDYLIGWIDVSAPGYPKWAELILKKLGEHPYAITDKEYFWLLEELRYHSGFCVVFIDPKSREEYERLSREKYLYNVIKRIGQDNHLLEIPLPCEGWSIRECAFCEPVKTRSHEASLAEAKEKGWNVEIGTGPYMNPLTCSYNYIKIGDKICKRDTGPAGVEGHCPDCGVPSGSVHHIPCEMERCMECSRQLRHCVHTIGAKYFRDLWDKRGVPEPYHEMFTKYIDPSEMKGLKEELAERVKDIEDFIVKMDEDEDGKARLKESVDMLKDILDRGISLSSNQIYWVYIILSSQLSLIVDALGDEEKEPMMVTNQRDAMYSVSRYFKGGWRLSISHDMWVSNKQKRYNEAAKSVMGHDIPMWHAENPDKLMQVASESMSILLKLDTIDVPEGFVSKCLMLVDHIHKIQTTRLDRLQDNTELKGLESATG